MLGGKLMNSENPIGCVVISIKAMAFDYIASNNDDITVEEERAICSFVNYITTRMMNVNGKEGRDDLSQNEECSHKK